MKERGVFEISCGAIISVVSWLTWEQVIASIILAFIGGISGYLGKKIIQIIYHKYFKKKIEK